MKLSYYQNIFRDGFGINEPLKSIEPLSGGRIHETFLLETAARRYILQRMNRQAFSRPTALMENIRLITEALQKSTYPLQVPKYLFYSSDGLFEAPDGSLFRAMEYIPHADTEGIPLEKLSNEAGWAYGHFLCALSEVSAEKINEPIRGFHDTRGRVAMLRESMRAHGDIAPSDMDRIEALLRYEGKAALVQELSEKRELPLRITHNDTKLSNVLFTSEGKAIAVVDMDTVMPGLMAYDYGDAIRSMAKTETAFGLQLNLQALQAFTEVYLSATKEVRTAQETSHLADGILSVTFELSVRYWTDYLSGERYFQTDYKGQCRDRAIRYTELLEEIDRNMDKIRNIIRACDGC